MTTEKTYFRPRSIEEAVQLAAEHADSRFLAGGTDVLVNKFHGTDTRACLIDLTGIPELYQVWKKEDMLYVGALIALDALKQQAEIVREFPVLLEAAQSVAAPVIRKTATLGGNILCENRCIFFNQSAWWRQAAGFCLKCNGEICIASGGKKNCFSKFASDMAVALISLDATVEVLEKDGGYEVPLEEIYTGDGVNPRLPGSAALVKAIGIPLGRGFRSVFKKLRRRKSLEFSSLTSVVTTDRDGHIRIVLGGVDPRPVLVEGTTDDDRAALIHKAVKKARIVNNDTYPRLYRKEMTGVYLNKSFEELFD